MSGIFGDWRDPNAIEVESAPPKPPSPIGMGKIAMGVFLGNLLTGILGTILYLLVDFIRALART